MIKEGYVRCKEGKLFPSWNQRFLILREFRLEFLKNETGKMVLSIPLSHVTGVARSEDTKMAFEIVRLANPKDATSKTALMTRDVPTKTITCEVKTDDEIYEWIDKIYERCPGMGGVSNPTNFSHRVHVGFDAQSGAFFGLPPEWEKLLTSSALTKEDYKKNPQAVIEVLEFYSEIQMRDQNPQAQYGGLPATPFPGQQPAKPFSSQSMGGSSVAPPRPPPPGPAQRLDTGLSPQEKYAEESTPSATSSPAQSQERSPEADRAQEQQQQLQRMKDLADQERRRLEEEARQKRQREEEQWRQEQEAYQASLPKTRVPLAKQELGGYGGGGGGGGLDENRFKPSRPAPQAPNTARPPPPSNYTPQRPAPSPYAAPNHYPGASRPPGPRPDEHSMASSARYRANESRSPGPQGRPQNNGVKAQPAQGPPPSRLPAPVQPVKPLNIANKQNNANNANNKSAPGVRQAEAALTTKKPEPKKEVRMSRMTESEVMEKLRTVVSRDNPNESYSKQRKIGQGASGSVYVARIKESATTPIARELYRQYGPRCQVAVKQMDLRSQPRKELIVNEIIVMKDSKHANVVNFLDSFLQEQSNELWVIMEFMEGGALTDIIDNNAFIQEDQIATICAEVRFSYSLVIRGSVC